MSIYIGNSELKNAYVGSNAIKKIYVSNNLVWPNDDPYLTISPNNKSLVNTLNTTYEIEIDSNVAWTASETSSWISLSKTSGSGNDTVTVIVDENISNDSRQATITFEHNDPLPVNDIIREHTLNQVGRAYAQVGLRTDTQSMSGACSAPIGQITFYTDEAVFADATGMWSNQNRTSPAPPGWYAVPNQSVVRYFNGNSFTITDSCF